MEIILKFRNSVNNSYTGDMEIKSDVIPRVGENFCEIQHGQKSYIVDLVEYLYSDTKIEKPIVYLTQIKGE